MLAEPARRWRIPASIALAAFGLAISLYLTISHFSGGETACVFGQGCDLVAASDYATLFGIPVALLGVLNYSAMAALVVMEAAGPEKQRGAVRLGVVLLASAGLVYSIYLTLVSANAIGAYCPWCLASLASTAALFSVSFGTLYPGSTERLT